MPAVFKSEGCRTAGVPGELLEETLYIFSSPPLIYPFFHSPAEKEKERPRATFITASLNYTNVIKQYTFNHSHC